MKAVIQTSLGLLEVAVFCIGCFVLGFIGGQLLQAVLA